VLLAKATGLRATYLLAFETSHPLRFQLKVGNNVRSLHAASAGKAILGSLTDEALQAALVGLRLTAFTPRTATSVARLRDMIEAGRGLGYYVNQGESIEGLTTISAPFYWQHSLYIVTIAAPASRLDDRIAEAASRLLEVCSRLEMKGR